MQPTEIHVLMTAVSQRFPLSSSCDNENYFSISQSSTTVQFLKIAWSLTLLATYAKQEQGEQRLTQPGRSLSRTDKTRSLAASL